MEKVIDQCEGSGWIIYHADCVEVARSLPDNSVGFSIFSPPYSSLFVYSASDRDMGNTKDDAEFFEHFSFLLPELMRITKPGRIVAVDVMNLTSVKERDGYIGIRDFRGEMIRHFVAAGFIFHSEHCIWKDPLLAAVRTHTIGLAYKQLKKDSTMSRAGIPQYLLAFRKPGVNPEPVAHQNGLEYWIGEDKPTSGQIEHEMWRRYASPVWMDVNPGRTLNFRAAREDKDERHLCPMSLDISERGLQLWSNEGDVVFSPFAGIGSEGHMSIKMGRKFIGCELKKSYFQQACGNLKAAEVQQESLFTDAHDFQATEPAVIPQDVLDEIRTPQEPQAVYVHKIYGACKHGGPGLGFPCEECRAEASA